MSDTIEMIVMPKWGLAMQEGMIAQWHVAEGAEIKKGQEIVDIETSKIANVFESPIDGTLRKIVVADGETVPVAYLIGVVAPAAVSDADVDAFVDDFKANFVVEDTDAGGPEPEDIETAAGRISHLALGDGAGDPIIFIHGYGGDLNNWMFNQEELSASHTTYAIDLPGHGRSTKQVGDGDVASLAKAVLAFMDAKGVKKAHLVGHSMGGAIALALALDSADRVVSVTAMSPAGLGDEINMDYINGFIAEKRAKKLEGARDLKVSRIKEIEIDGLPGFEVQARGKDAATGESIFVYQVILYEEVQYYLIVGIVKSGRKGKALTLFRKAAATFVREKPEGE